MGCPHARGPSLALILKVNTANRDGGIRTPIGGSSIRQRTRRINRINGLRRQKAEKSGRIRNKAARSRRGLHRGILATLARAIRHAGADSATVPVPGWSAGSEAADRNHYREAWRASAKAGGEFETTGFLPGRYNVSVGVPGGWAASKMNLGPRDAMR